LGGKVAEKKRGKTGRTLGGPLAKGKRGLSKKSMSIHPTRYREKSLHHPKRRKLSRKNWPLFVRKGKRGKVAVLAAWGREKKGNGCKGGGVDRLLFWFWSLGNWAQKKRGGGKGFEKRTSNHPCDGGLRKRNG